MKTNNITKEDLAELGFVYLKDYDEFYKKISNNLHISIMLDEDLLFLCSSNKSNIRLEKVNTINKIKQLIKQL